ncbi:hypothetical protein [Helicobacter pylori]
MLKSFQKAFFRALCLVRCVYWGVNGKSQTLKSCPFGYKELRKIFLKLRNILKKGLMRSC